MGTGSREGKGGYVQGGGRVGRVAGIKNILAHLSRLPFALMIRRILYLIACRLSPDPPLSPSWELL